MSDEEIISLFLPGMNRLSYIRRQNMAHTALHWQMLFCPSGKMRKKPSAILT